MLFFKLLSLTPPIFYLKLMKENYLIYYYNIEKKLYNKLVSLILLGTAFKKNY